MTRLVKESALIALLPMKTGEIIIGGNLLFKMQAKTHWPLVTH